MAFVFFAYFAVVSIVAGILTVSLKHPVQCGLALLALLLHVSGLFIMLNAEFLWAVQVIVYAGAILVLYLFVLMLLNLKTDDRYFHAKTPYLLAPAAIGLLYLLFFWCDRLSVAQKAMPPRRLSCRTEMPMPSASRCSASTCCSLKLSACS